jgi:hypothetical protein
MGLENLRELVWRNRPHRGIVGKIEISRER